VPEERPADTASPQKERSASVPSTPWTPNARAAPFTPSSSRVSPHGNLAGEAVAQPPLTLEAGSRSPPLVPSPCGYDGYDGSAYTHYAEVGVHTPSMQYGHPPDLQQQLDEAAFIEGFMQAQAQMQAQAAPVVPPPVPPTFVKPVYSPVSPVLPHTAPVPVPAMAPLPPQVPAPAPPMQLNMQHAMQHQSAVAVAPSSPAVVLQTPPAAPQPASLPQVAPQQLAQQPHPEEKAVASDGGKALLLKLHARENGGKLDPDEKSGRDSPRTSLLRLCGAWQVLEKGKILDRDALLGFKSVVSDESPPTELGSLTWTER